MAPYTFPDDYDSLCCFLVPIPGALIPFVAGALKVFEQRRAWHTDAEYETAYNAFAELQVCMTRLCARELLEAQQQTYRLIDTALNGTQYSASGSGTVEDPLVVLPAIPAAPPFDLAELPGLVKNAEIAMHLLDNLTNATVWPEATDPRNLRQQLDDLIAATGGQGLDDEQLAELVKIAVLLA